MCEILSIKHIARVTCVEIVSLQFCLEFYTAFLVAKLKLLNMLYRLGTFVNNRSMGYIKCQPDLTSPGMVMTENLLYNNGISSSDLNV